MTTHKNKISFYIFDDYEVIFAQNVIQDYKEHLHEKLCLGYVVSGSAKMISENREITLKAGDTYIVNPLTVHRVTFKGSPADYLVICFRGKDSHKDLTPITNNSVLSGLFKNLIHCLQKKEMGLKIECIIAEILLNCFRLYNIGSEPAENNIKIDSAMQYIKDNCSTLLTVDEISRKSTCSKFHFIRQFKEKVGITPYEYLIQQRIALSKKCLRNGDSCLEVALKLNFSDQSHFINQFKKYTGVTPKAYKNNAFLIL